MRYASVKLPIKKLQLHAIVALLYFTGLLGKAMTEMSEKEYSTDDQPAMAIHYRCYSNNATLDDCVPDWGVTCSSGTAVKVECACKCSPGVL